MYLYFGHCLGNLSSSIPVNCPTHFIWLRIKCFSILDVLAHWRTIVAGIMDCNLKLMILLRHFWWHLFNVTTVCGRPNLRGFQKRVNGTYVWYILRLVFLFRVKCNAIFVYYRLLLLFYLLLLYIFSAFTPIS